VGRDLKSEQAVIGSILMEPDCIDLVKKYIPNGSYFIDRNLGKTLDAVYKMYDAGQVIDLTTVYDTVPDVSYLLSEVMDALVTTAHVEEYAKMVRDSYARRALKKLITGVNPLDTKKYNTPLDAVTEIEKSIRGIEQIIQNAEEMSALELVSTCLDDIEKDMEQGQNKNILPTGI
jgi:replicative DNA helicase